MTREKKLYDYGIIIALINVWILLYLNFLNFHWCTAAEFQSNGLTRYQHINLFSYSEIGLMKEISTELHIKKEQTASVQVIIKLYKAL